MEEIAATLEGAGLPAGFHRAAAEVYGRLAEFKDDRTVGGDAVLDALLDRVDQVDQGGSGGPGRIR
jgi:hypothetical protein